MKKNNFNIELQQLSVGYEQPGGNPLEILKAINFSATPGEMVALIGSNGIGKSTLLRTLAGFQPWFSGNIQISGRNLKNINSKEVARIMSFVSTENVRVPNLSVFDLVAYGRFPYTNWIGMLSELDKSVVDEAIKNVGLQGFENRPVMQISDGERQRAMIARALAQDTPVIILDEPTAYLDVSNKYEIFHLLQVLANKKKKTIILSTHDLNIALREVDKLWIATDCGNYQGAPEDAVLQGWLNQLFKNDHVGFDADEGEFFFKKEFKAKVKVEGGGLPLTWTLRALNRKGYQIVMQAEHDYRVVAKENSWELISKGNQKTFGSVYELMAFLETPK
ncbi:iron complex transport system ATP-binding protein [Tangfeifania diversioriginum]|uniref:Iron complex transport system ATP-binding protein n=1 Tax=Tangfeifania diversioriginum TaxID=1168035 RepID=A0A1M6NZ66_9BACT|nr:ABC transporter ATP-binding protein [Tangfeifania diversioriginum]SHK00986.1 iron complex transport system ATP-binding protein [Tangfeifania diversioriginum]